MAMIKWKKKDGTELESNDHPETVDKCEELGWKRVGGDVPKTEPKPTKETKDQSKDSPK